MTPEKSKPTRWSDQIRQPVSLAIFGFSLAIHAVFTLRFFLADTTHELIDVVTFTVLISTSIALSMSKPLIRLRWIYLISAFLHAVIAAPLVSFLNRFGFDPHIWVIIIVVESVIYLPTFAGTNISVLYIAIYTIVSALSPTIMIWRLIQNVIILALCAAGILVFRRYRDELVQRERDVVRLDGAVLRLSRANTSYQQNAIDAEERSTERERQRITRDIHDIVGYTLTNNMVTIEAAVDMIRVDPLRVPALLQSARENAEDGLSQIRKSLYRLREQNVEHPKGIAGISRMVRNFGTATSIDVDLEIGGIPPLKLVEKVSYVTHHFVQEAIINSFRHGRATKVLVMLYWSEEQFIAKVWDNGPGASDAMKEGIGISGMRERASQVEGNITFERVIDGFSITLNIPRSQIS